MFVSSVLRKRRADAPGETAPDEGGGGGAGQPGSRRSSRTILGSLFRLCIGILAALWIQRRNREFDDASVPPPDEPEFTAVDNATQIFRCDQFLSPAEVAHILTFVEGLGGWGLTDFNHLELPVEGYIAAARKDVILGRIEERIANHTGIPAHPHEDILSIARHVSVGSEPRGGHFPPGGLHHDSHERPDRAWTLLVYLEVPSEGGRTIFPLAGESPEDKELAERQRYFAKELQAQFGGIQRNFSRRVTFDPLSDHPFMDLIEESCRGSYGVSFSPPQPGSALLFPSDSQSKRTWYADCNVLNGTKVVLQKYKEAPFHQRKRSEHPPYQPWKTE